MPHALFDACQRLNMFCHVELKQREEQNFSFGTQAFRLEQDQKTRSFKCQTFAKLHRDMLPWRITGIGFGL